MAKNVIAIRIGSYGNTDLELERLRKLGLTNVECGLPSADGVDDLVARLKRHGLTATTLSVDLPIHQDDVLDGMKAAVGIAKRMGVERFFTSIHSHGLPLPAVYDRLREIGDIAAEANVLVGMETHEDLCQNAQVAATTFEAVGHPHIGLNLDTANIYYYNQDVDTAEDGVELTRRVARYVSSVHIKDTNGGFHDGRFPAVGEGIVDFAGIFAALNAAGFYGPFTFEHEGHDPKVIGVEGVDRIVSTSLQHLKDLGLA